MENTEKTIEITLSEYNIFIKQAKRISELESQVQWLMEQFKLSKRRQFGSSSEQTASDQLSLLDGALNLSPDGSPNLFNEAEDSSDPSISEPDLKEIKAYFRKKTRLTTDKLPKDLPIESIEYVINDADTICPDCGHDLHVMGEEIREELKIIPARASLVKHIRKVYTCRHCEQNADIDAVPFVKAEFPNPVIKGSFAAPETIAHIASQKFVMSSPLYRQEQEWKQNGIAISRQTMSNWLVKAAELWLYPIYDEMKRQLLASDAAHADETTMQVLHEDGKTAQSKSYMWHYRTSGCAEHQIVLYEYQPDRKYERPAEFLKGFKGYLHTDGYEGYHRLSTDITVVGCWAHLRRKFDEALATVPKDKQSDCEASKGKAYCDKLFYLEKQFVSLTPENRFKERRHFSKPLVAEFYQWVCSVCALPKTLLGRACQYAVSQRKYLENYLLDGRLEISNNRAENSIRPFVMGRKNWLFSNTPNGATASAVYYSLIVSAKENGLVPYEYLAKVFTDAPNGVMLAKLMPW